MEQPVETGRRAPFFSLISAGSGWRVSLREAMGRKTVLIFHLQGTAPAAHEINQAVRETYPSPDDVLVASVIDLSIVPPVYWFSVSLVLNTAYDKAAAELPEGANPADYVVILPDWSGLTSRKFGIRNTGRAAAVVVVNEDATIAGAYQGESPVGAVMQLLTAEC